MPIDNSAAIRKLLHFEISGDVYYVQVMQRGKDPGNSRDKIIKDYHIHDFEQFDRTLPEIKEMCEKYYARAMIRLNQRNTMDANIVAQINALHNQLEINRVLRKMVRTGKADLGLPKIPSIQHLYSSALGTTCTEDGDTKKWIIDIDPDMVDSSKPGFDTIYAIADTFMKYIVAECGKKDGVPKEYCRLPSKHGLHLVTSTFRMDKFNTHFGKPGNQNDYVMVDANTNLYIPD